MKSPIITSNIDQQNYYAAVDLGSNSFHLVIVQVINGSVQIVGKIKQKVRLAAGLDEQNRLDDLSMERGWKCLESFAERLQDIPRDHIKIVGTATLRLATNAPAFVAKGEKILKHPIDVISGEEEARQIFLGVAYTSANQGLSLVIDIGGASTEVIVGSEMQPKDLVSLDVGCVTFMSRFFPDQRITEAGFQQAISAAKKFIEPHAERFIQHGWNQCLGASGTPQAVHDILVARNIADPIKLTYLYQIMDQSIAFGHVNYLDFNGLAESRKAIFPSGLAILIALFECLSIEQMQISGGALREGLIYGMLDQVQHTDLRTKSVQFAMDRFHIDKEQALRVNQVAMSLFGQYCHENDQACQEYASVISAAAFLHEVGLHIDYKLHHQHGAYILSHTNLLGFSHIQKKLLCLLVANHRQAIDVSALEQYLEPDKSIFKTLCRLLRLAVVLCLRRKDQSVPQLHLVIEGDDWSLTFPNGWLKQHPLIEVELTNEIWLQHRAGMKLSVQ